MELKTLWLCMGAAFLVFGMFGSLKPDWLLSCAWTLHPHHITPETIAHLHGESAAELDRPAAAETPAVRHPAKHDAAA